MASRVVCHVHASLYGVVHLHTCVCVCVCVCVYMYM